MPSRFKNSWPYFLFLALKLPLLFAPVHWEELRDLDAFLRVSEGQVPYRDFYWHYGAVSPLFFGAVLKALPPVLVSLRAVTLAVNFAVFCLALALLRRFLAGKWAPGMAALIATLSLSVPNYSHNHALVQACLLASVYFGLRYVEGARATRDLALSFFFVAALLGVRPLLTGCVATFGWLALYWFLESKPAVEKAKTILSLLGGLALASAPILLLYGSSLRSGFYPRAGAMYPPQGYPNLYGLSVLWKLRPFTLVGAIKALRTVFDILFFYFNFFVWPTVAGLLFYLSAEKKRAGASLVLWLVAMTASIEVLYYGDINPSADPILLNRGQYFLVLTWASVLILAWPRSARVVPRTIGYGLVTAMTLFSLIPSLAAVHRFSESKVNPYGFRELTGVAIPPILESAFEPLALARELCHGKHALFMGLYSPGYARLTGCRDILHEDDHLTDLGLESDVKKRQSVYTPTADENVRTILNRRIASENPAVILAFSDSPFLSLCTTDEWETKVFPHFFKDRVVCWRKGLS